MTPRLPLAPKEALQLGASSEGGSLRSNISVADDKESHVLFVTCNLYYGSMVLSCIGVIAFCLYIVTMRNFIDSIVSKLLVFLFIITLGGSNLSNKRRLYYCRVDKLQY